MENVNKKRRKNWLLSMARAARTIMANTWWKWRSTLSLCWNGRMITLSSTVCTTRPSCITHTNCDLTQPWNWKQWECELLENMGFVPWSLSWVWHMHQVSNDRPGWRCWQLLQLLLVYQGWVQQRSGHLYQTSLLGWRLHHLHCSILTSTETSILGMV
jgi:hypothetical protein